MRIEESPYSLSNSQNKTKFLKKSTGAISKQLPTRR
jgi:hypothetical protein